MLHLLQQTRSSQSNRLERGRVAAELSAVHIAQGSAFGADKGDTSAFAKRVHEAASSMGVQLAVLPLEAVFQSAEQPLEPVDVQDSSSHQQAWSCTGQLTELLQARLV